MYQDDRFYFDTFKFDDIFESSEEFIAKMKSVGGITDSTSLTELYNILSFKYVNSYTRYTSEFPFLMAIKRELYTEFPFYLKKKELADEMMALEIAEIQINNKQLRNLVGTHDEPIVSASTVAIDDLSTEQENITMTSNRLEAIKNKYAVMNRDYLKGIYQRCDGLFRVILVDDVRTLYPQ